MTVCLWGLPLSPKKEGGAVSVMAKALRQRPSTRGHSGGPKSSCRPCEREVAGLELERREMERLQWDGLLYKWFEGSIRDEGVCRREEGKKGAVLRGL